MTNTPTTRPPNRPRNGRRPLEGRHAVPLPPRHQQRRDQLVRAAEALRATGKPDLAEAVEFVLTPEALAFVKQVRQEALGVEYASPPNIAINVPTLHREQIKALAEAEDVNLTEEVEKGFRSFLKGEFTPRPIKAARNSRVGYVAINVRPNQELRDLVKVKCDRMNKNRKTGIRALAVSTVAMYALYARFQVGPYAPDAETDTAE